MGEGVTLAVSLTLKDAAGRVLWSGKRMVDEETYSVSPAKLQTEANRKAAVSMISDRLSERVSLRITEGG